MWLKKQALKLMEKLTDLQRNKALMSEMLRPHSSPSPRRGGEQAKDVKRLQQLLKEQDIAKSDVEERLRKI